MVTSSIMPALLLCVSAVAIFAGFRRLVAVHEPVRYQSADSGKLPVDQRGNGQLEFAPSTRVAKNHRDREKHAVARKRRRSEKCES
jgi:hypothetical protein